LLILIAMHPLLILALLATPPSTCGLGEPYADALCAYQRRQFTEAEAGFRALSEREADDAVKIRSLYFLARTEMKLGRYDEAEPLLIRIYAMSPAFYAEWNCDFLLGECRRARGKT
jgi:TolA-binding protein